MQDTNAPILQLEQVSRSFPQDMADTPSAVLREMLLPRRMLQITGGYCLALRDISFNLSKGQKLGVIGTHRSGKTTLAGIASGMLQPTSGRVTASSSRLLISRPTAGFKPALTLKENLAFRASLGGLCGDALAALIEQVLERNRIAANAARSPLGNFSPYLVRQLGMELLLQLPAETLVIDELVSAGAGDARWATRAALLDRIASSTALIVSTDYEFLKESTEEAMVLHQGQLSGPFPTVQAYEHFIQLPNKFGQADDFAEEAGALEGSGEEDDGAALVPTKERFSVQAGAHSAPASQQDETSLRRAMKRPLGPSAVVQRIRCDGEEYERSRLYLLRAPGEVLEVAVDVLPGKTFVCTAIGLSLYSSNGMAVGSAIKDLPPIQLSEGVSSTVRFQLRIPDLPRNLYGLAMQLAEEGLPARGHIKLIMFGLQTDTLSESGLSLDVSGHAIERAPT